MYRGRHAAGTRGVGGPPKLPRCPWRPLGCVFQKKAISFKMTPSHQEVRRQWLRRPGRDPPSPTCSSRGRCSLHAQGEPHSPPRCSATETGLKQRLNREFWRPNHTQSPRRASLPTGPLTRHCLQGAEVNTSPAERADTPPHVCRMATHRLGVADTANPAWT